MSETIISVKSLVKTYKMGDVEVHALRGVNVDIRKGDFVAIMGKSGSGEIDLHEHPGLSGCRQRRQL